MARWEPLSTPISIPPTPITAAIRWPCFKNSWDTLSGTYSLSFDGGNAYVLPYASNLNRVPIRHSGYTGETSAVPFLQLAVAGAMTCQSASLNLDEDIQTALLGCIESRTSPSFVLAADHVQRLKTTEHTAYYAVSYPVLKETVLEQYR